SYRERTDSLGHAYHRPIDVAVNGQQLLIMMAKIIERAGLVIVAGAALLAPAFKFEDAGIYFNNANNVLSPDIIYISGSYVPLIPQATAFAVHGLPPAVQIFLYRLVPLVALYVLYRELKKLFRLACSELDAVCIAMACLFYFCYFEHWVLAILTWVIWPALFAALVYAVRIQISGERYSFPGAAGL